MHFVFLLCSVSCINFDKVYRWHIVVERTLKEQPVVVVTDMH